VEAVLPRLEAMYPRHQVERRIEASNGSLVDDASLCLWVKLPQNTFGSHVHPILAAPSSEPILGDTTLPLRKVRRHARMWMVRHLRMRRRNVRRERRSHVLWMRWHVLLVLGRPSWVCRWRLLVRRIVTPGHRITPTAPHSVAPCAAYGLGVWRSGHC
jgi:hypothetical protein